MSKARGFTIIEIVVILGIIALLTSSLILYSRSGERQVILFREQSRIISALSRAKSLALATFGQPDVPCGYGVHFEARRTFLIFKDLSFDCATSDHRYSGGEEVVESFELSPVISFDALPITDVVFIPPDPTVILTPDQEQAIIFLKTTDGRGSAFIKLTSAGQISTR